MSKGEGLRQPPPGVERRPKGRVVPLAEAADRLGKDPRTLIRAITDGVLRGGALPRRERLRWYVYEDELPPSPPEDTPAPAASTHEAPLTPGLRERYAAARDLVLERVDSPQ